MKKPHVSSPGAALCALVVILAIGAILSIVLIVSPDAAKVGITSVTLLTVVFVSRPAVLRALKEPIKELGELFKETSNDRE
jgi:hypothetical protein